MTGSKLDDNFEIDLDTILEERKLSTLLGFAFLAVWILSIVFLYYRN